MPGRAGTSAGRSHEPHHGSCTLAADNDDGFFDEFFDGVPFEAPCTLGDLLKSDYVLSPRTCNTNERWLQTPHPDHFLKETDRDSRGGSPRRLSRAFTAHDGAKDCRADSRVHAGGEGKATADGRQQGRQAKGLLSKNVGARPPGSDDKENRKRSAGVRDEQQQQQQQQQQHHKRGAGLGASVAEVKSQPAKRRRAACGVAASASTTRSAWNSRAAQSAPEKPPAKDVMKRRLQEYREKTRRSTARPVREPNPDKDERTKGAAARDTSSGRDVVPSLRRGRAAGAAGVSTACPSVARPSRTACESTDIDIVNASACRPVPETVVLKTVSRRASAAKGGSKSLALNASKSSAPDSLASARGGSNIGARLRRRPSPAAAAVEVVAHERKLPRSPLGGAPSGNRRNTAQSSIGAGEATLVLDPELEARLALHNKGVTRGKHTYEPKRSVRDCRMWEEKTGKVYRTLSVDDRADANREIDTMRAAMRDDQRAGR